MSDCNGEMILVAFIMLPIGLLLWGAVMIMAFLVIENVGDALKKWRDRK